jgi:hypothetical protein
MCCDEMLPALTLACPAAAAAGWACNGPEHCGHSPASLSEHGLQTPIDSQHKHLQAGGKIDRSRNALAKRSLAQHHTSNQPRLAVPYVWADSDCRSCINTTLC